MQSQSWTEDRVETLRKLWLEGLSASRIAAELGGVTRNAVIGKVHRMGLSGRGQGEGAPASAAPQPAPQSEPRAPAPAPAVLSSPKPPAAARPAARQPENGVVVPISKRLPIEKLTERTCKWPIGDPGHQDFHFCGHDSLDGLPYCRYHAALAYQAADPRRRLKAAG